MAKSGADLENLQGGCTLAGQLASMHVINVNTKRLETQVAYNNSKLELGEG